LNFRHLCRTLGPPPSEGTVTTTASEKQAPAEEGKRTEGRFWRRISKPLVFFRRTPTALVVTLVGLLLSAWLLPALTRQWDDRQKANELKVSLSTAVATADARVMTNVLVMARNTRQGDQRHHRRLLVVSPMERDWVVTSSELGARMFAYFPKAAVAWDSWAYMVDRLIVRASGGRETILDDPADFGALDQFPKGWDTGLALSYEDAQAAVARIMHSDNAHLLSEIRGEQVWLDGLPEAMLEDIASGHPTGYSTTFGDLLHDLVP